MSFVELEQHIEGFSGGDMELGFNNDDVSNIVLWTGLTKEAADAMEELRVNRHQASRTAHRVPRTAHLAPSTAHLAPRTAYPSP